MVSRHLYSRRFAAWAALVFGIAFAFGAITHEADADPSHKELREARATFQAGLALEAAGDYKGALAKFREVADVKQTSQVTFHIGTCLEQLGLWTEALGNYRIAIDRARDEGAEDVVSNADSARQKLEVRMPKIRVVRGKGAAGAVVELDGERIGAASFGVEMPADPGGYRVVGRLHGKTMFEQTVVLKEGSVETVNVSVQEEVVPPSPEPKMEKEAGPSERTGYIFLGAGITSIVVGGMFVKLRNDTIDQLESQCVGEVCSSSVEDTSNRGRIYTIAANAFLGVGVISTAIGSIVLLQRDSQPEKPEQPKSSPAAQVGLSVVGPGGSTGAMFWGRF